MQVHENIQKDLVLSVIEYPHCIEGLRDLNIGKSSVKCKIQSLYSTPRLSNG